MGHRVPVSGRGRAGRIPRFTMVGVVLGCMVLYALLTVFLVAFVYVKSIPVPQIAAHTELSPPLPQENSNAYPTFVAAWLGFTHSPSRLGAAFRAVMVLCLIALFVVHAPVGWLLARKRLRKDIPPQLQSCCEAIALRSARITGWLFLAAAGSDTMSRALSMMQADGRLRDFFVRCIPFYVVTSILVFLFAYYWQNHRIKLIYAPFIFGPSGPTAHARVKRRKTIGMEIGFSKIITAVLPLTLVLLYFLAFVTPVDLRAIPEGDRAVLLGSYDAIYRAMAAQIGIPASMPFTVPYMTPVDTVLFAAGVSTAFIVALLMLVLISKWSTRALVVPLEELERNVRLAATGDFDHVTPVRDTDEIGRLTEQFNGMLASVKDSQRLRVEKEAAEAANRSKSSFLATMSHELRTPLNAIIGFAQLLARGRNLDEEQRQSLATITRSGTHLLGLINDILDMSKIEAGRTELTTAAFDFHEMLRGLEGMFGLRASEKGLSLILDLSPEVPRFVSTDEAKLRQVLVNLLGNAVKFTEKGGATLRVHARPEAAGAVRLLFEVEDSGPGIALEDQRRLFEPFVQTAGGAVSQEGTGLGLAISKAYVSLLGGGLTVKSEPGQGSTFAFDVRVILAEASQIASAKPRRVVTGLEPGQGRYRILVAEDRDSNRELLVKLLEPIGFEVRTARNGAECVSAWEAWEPHLIWMDMRMPVMDGYEATRRIKATTKGQATVIIALTASAFEADRKLILSEGCDDFVRKPFVEEEIYGKLEKHLGVRFLTAEPAEAAAAAPPATVGPEAFAALPEAWRTEFVQATVKADYARLQEMLAAVRGANPEAARALTELVNGFAYERIMELLGSPG